jgi:hypothetical protein
MLILLFTVLIAWQWRLYQKEAAGWKAEDTAGK